MWPSSSKSSSLQLVIIIYPKSYTSLISLHPLVKKIHKWLTLPKAPMTLQVGSRSPKPIQLLCLQLCLYNTYANLKKTYLLVKKISYIQNNDPELNIAGLMKIHQLVQKSSHFWEKLPFISWLLTLIIQSGSQYYIQPLGLSQRYVCASKEKSIQWLKKYITLSEKFTYLNPRVTLKMRSRSPKSNKLLRLSK